MEAILEIIQSIDSNQPNVNPTEIYNEGWMTRLLVYHSIKQEMKLEHVIDFSSINNWTSEGLISSPFISSQHQREGYTHADMAIGDFEVDFRVRGEIRVNDNAKIFGIIEAKMGSNLSQRTSNVKDYNQVSRNITCISHNTFDKDCTTFFVVLAPKSTIDKHHIRKQVHLDHILEQIRKRFNEYPSDSIERENQALIMQKVNQCKTFIIDYQDWIDRFHKSEREFLQDFYEKCLEYNRIQ